MAIVAHTPYTGSADCSRTNEYISDGHGLAIDRTNRYISNGHGGHTICEGFNCPADPVLATEYMETVRLNYERQHPPGENRSKGSVTHEQLYVSPTAEDNVPPEERMQMTRELISRTILRDFPSIFCPHDNEPDKHCHISLCPFSVDGTHKLSMNNSLLNDLRREMDRICVEHGYSIIENPELWSDKEYRDWFFHIKEEGVVKIHPPKEQSMASFKKDRKRARTYSASKQSQAEHEAEQAKYIKKMTAGYSPEKAEFFYHHPFLFDPVHPDHELRLRKFDPNGKEVSDIELQALSLFVWSYTAEKELAKHKGSQGLQHRLRSYTNKTQKVADFLRDLDIRTHEELVAHIKECGGDIAELKQDIKRQGTILESMAEVMDAIDRWENQKDTESYAYLKAHRCGSPEEIADAKKRYSRAVARKATNEALLQDRSREYRNLKTAESTLHPASGKEEWQGYLEEMFSKVIQKKLEYVSADELRPQLQSMGKAAGLDEEEVDRLIEKANQTDTAASWEEYRQFMRISFTPTEKGRETPISGQIGGLYDDIHRLRNRAQSVPVLGPFTFVLALTVGTVAGVQESIKRREIAELKWEAELMRHYARDTRRERMAKMKEAKSMYDAEIIDASEAEIEAAKVRFYERAAEINGRLDIVMDIARMKQAKELDAQISDAVKKKLNQIEGNHGIIKKKEASL